MSDIVPSSSRQCRECQQVKPISDFYPHMKNYCKKCASLKASQRIQRNKAKNQSTTQPSLLGVEQTLQCRDCKEVKPLDQFRKDITAIHGYKRICKQCHARVEESRRANSSGERRRYRDWELAHAYEYKLRCKYDLTLDWYATTFAEQGGVCAACGNPETTRNGSGEIRKLAVDHDHQTGKIRGLLCGGCNLALGLLEDDPDRILRLLAYLEKYQIKE